MNSYIDIILDFFIRNFPPLKAIAIGGPIALSWATLCLMFAGFLKMRKNWKTGYTRKVFHFLIFGTVIGVHWIWNTSGVCLFGGMTSLVIAYALFRGSGYFMYEAMAREKDAPHRTYYVIIPYFATLIGGLMSSIFFPATVVFGFLVAGLGDAIAEPVGTRWGKHKYNVPTIWGLNTTRSLEGSASVLFVSLLALFMCLVFSHQFELSLRSILIVIFIAATSTIVEALSPHGWDNATMQVVPAMLGAGML